MPEEERKKHRKAWKERSAYTSRFYKFNKKRKAHEIKDVAYKGVHSFMRDHISPAGSRLFPLKRFINKRAGKGSKFGTTIHNKLRRYTETGKEVGGITTLVRCLYEERGIVLIDGEVPVWINSKRLATRVDLLGFCLNTKTFVVIEIKTHALCDPTAFTQYMRKPYEKLPFSMKNEGLMQAIISDFMFRRTYPNLKMSSPLLVHSTGGKVTIYHANDIVKHLPPLFSVLKS